MLAEISWREGAFLSLPIFAVEMSFMDKMIIARTKHPIYSYEGIEIHDIADWLLQE